MRKVGLELVHAGKPEAVPGCQIGNVRLEAHALLPASSTTSTWTSLAGTRGSITHQSKRVEQLEAEQRGARSVDHLLDQARVSFQKAVDDKEKREDTGGPQDGEGGNRARLRRILCAHSRN